MKVSGVVILNKLPNGIEFFNFWYNLMFRINCTGKKAELDDLMSTVKTSSQIIRAKLKGECLERRIEFFYFFILQVFSIK